MFVLLFNSFNYRIQFILKGIHEKNRKFSLFSALSTAARNDRPERYIPKSAGGGSGIRLSLKVGTTAHTWNWSKSFVIPNDTSGLYGPALLTKVSDGLVALPDITKHAGADCEPGLLQMNEVTMYWNLTRI